MIWYLIIVAGAGYAHSGVVMTALPQVDRDQCIANVRWVLAEPQHWTVAAYCIPGAPK